MSADITDEDLIGGVPRSRIVTASMVGTTVEFYDFYIYATAAVSVFPQLFFPKGNATTALLASLATFGLAFVARPVGSMLFGHFGDRVGRKATLVGSLLMMGIATFAIGLLPTYHQAGLLAPALLAVLRSGQRNLPAADPVAGTQSRQPGPRRSVLDVGLADPLPAQFGDGGHRALRAGAAQ